MNRKATDNGIKLFGLSCCLISALRFPKTNPSYEPNWHLSYNYQIFNLLLLDPSFIHQMGVIKHHPSPMHQWPRTTTLGIAALALVAIFFLFTPGTTTAIPSIGPQQEVGRQKQEYDEPKNSHSSHQDADTGRVANGTLGFSKIFVVGLPERSDKRDAMTLTSALTGFHIDFVDGVRGETIPDKAVPFGVTDRKAFMETNLGSWRGHMNAIRR